MRKIIIALAALAVSTISLFAKTEKSEDVFYGPSKGDFAFSFGLMPTVNFIGNMFNGTDSQKYQSISGLAGTFFSGTTISAKYFLTDRFPINAILGMNWYTDNSFSYSEPNELDNIKSTGSHELMMMIGTQYLIRPGKRLQPVLGANFYYSHSDKSFNKLVSEDNGYQNDYNHKSPANAIGLVLNFGVEYYFCKNISLSACVDMGLYHKWTKKVVNDWDDKYSQTSSTRNSAVIGGLGGDLAINFYF